jgi:hypothetical protein
MKDRPMTSDPGLPAPLETRADPDVTVPRHALVVLGMHRSGTSALAGMLARLGADLPARQMVPTPDNPKGYYESDPLRLLNDRILASAGSSWDDWTRISQGWYDGPRAPAFHAEAREMLVAEFGNSPFFVFKDPRLCRLWPFWRVVLAAEGVRPLPVLAARHPLEVADSLSRRYSMAPSLSRLIGLRHQLDAEHDTRGSPRVFVRYDEVLADWRSVASRIEAAAGFAMPRRSPLAEAEVDDFLISGLRRYVHDSTDLAQHPGLPPFMVRAEDILTRLARGEAPDAAAQLDAIETELGALVPLFHDIGVQSRTRTREALLLGQERDALTARLAEVTTRLTGDRDAAITARDAAYTMRDAVITTRDAAITSRDAAITSRDAAITSRDAAITSRDAAITSRDEAITARDAAITSRDAAITSRDEAITSRDAAVAARAALAAELADRVRELAQMARMTAEREAAFAAQARTRLKEQETRILNEVFNSLSWKLTAPLRSMNRLYRRIRGRA